MIFRGQMVLGRLDAGRSEEILSLLMMSPLLTTNLKLIFQVILIEVLFEPHGKVFFHTAAFLVSADHYKTPLENS